MRKIKEICSEIVAARTSGNSDAAMDTAREELRTDVRGSLPDGASPVHIRAAVRLHEERAKAVDQRLALDAVFLTCVRETLMARTVEMAGSATAAAAVLASPPGKSRRADAVNKPVVKPNPTATQPKSDKRRDGKPDARRQRKPKPKPKAPASRPVSISVRGDRSGCAVPKTTDRGSIYHGTPSKTRSEQC